LFRRPLLAADEANGYLIKHRPWRLVDLAEPRHGLRLHEIAGRAGRFRDGPLPDSSPLWKMGERVILTPQFAGYSPRIAERHLAVLAGECAAVRGGPAAC